MTESITKSTLYNSFAVFQELLTGITALSTLNSKWGEDRSYFEDMPLFKATNFIGLPIMHIETEVETDSLTMVDKKMFPMTTTVSIYTDYHIENTSPKLNSYMNAITNYINTNKSTLRWTYGLYNVTVSKERERDVIHQKDVVVGILTFEYHVTLSTA